jgi:hypothetical protein
MQLEQDFAPFLSSIFVSVVLIRVASLGVETGAGYGGRDVKEISSIAKTDSERKVQKLRAFCTL